MREKPEVSLRFIKPHGKVRMKKQMIVIVLLALVVFSSQEGKDIKRRVQDIF
jgi:hypothetical protein